MRGINTGILVLCVGTLVADLSKPGQFQFASPVPIENLAAISRKVGPTIKQGMEEVEKREFIPRCQGGDKRRGISTQQLESLVVNWREGLTVEQVNRYVGEPLCGHPKSAEYATPQGVLVIGYGDGKTTGFELKNTRRKPNNASNFGGAAVATRGSD
jgi:hypothetical protein